MPNSFTGGCGPRLVRGDGLYFDFTRACRQHDLAYRWAPLPPSQRHTVESRFLSEMLHDCSRHGLVTSRLCAARALPYWTATSLFGGFSYGTRQTPGYNVAGTAETWPVPYSSCAQSSHVWVHTGGFAGRVPRNKSLYFTGVVRPHSRVRFQLIDAQGAVALEHVTHASYTNCVIRHEPEVRSTYGWAPGVYQIRATYTEWETDQVVTRTVGNLDLRTGGGGGGGGGGGECLNSSVPSCLE